MTAQIIEFRKADDWDAAVALFREILEKSDLTYEAAEWIYVDSLPRLKGLLGVWKNIRFDGDYQDRIAVEKALENNLVAAISSILLIEIQLYTATTGLLA